MTFPAEVNDNLLYRSPDGREAWILFDPTKQLAFIVTDIHNSVGRPEQAVGFSADTLRDIARRLDAKVGQEDEVRRPNGA